MSLSTNNNYDSTAVNNGDMAHSVYLKSLRRFLPPCDFDLLGKLIPSTMSPSELQALRDNPFPTSEADTAISGTPQKRPYREVQPGRTAAKCLMFARATLRLFTRPPWDVPSPGERQLNFTNYIAWSTEPPTKKQKIMYKNSPLLHVVCTDDVLEAPVSAGDDYDDDAASELSISWILGPMREDNDSDKAVYWTSDSSDRDTESAYECDRDESTEPTEPCLHGVEEEVSFTAPQEAHYSSDRDTESEYEADDDEGDECTEPCLDGAEEQVYLTTAQEVQSGSNNPSVDSMDANFFAGDGVLGGVGREILEALEYDDEGSEQETQDSAYSERIITLERVIRRGGWADDDDDDDDFEL